MPVQLTSLDISNIFSTQMASILFPREQEIREALVRRAEEFSRQTGISKTEIGKRAVNDGAFLGQVAEGRNFTIKLYRRLMDWLDANWPEPEMRRAKAKRGTPRHNRARHKASDSSKPNHRKAASARTAAVVGHFSRFRDVQRDHFRTAAEIEEHIRTLRDEWSHR
jgi:hypothetical protein